MRDAVRRWAKGAVPNRILRRRVGAKGSRAVLLTFDDGPDPRLTPEVLDLLDEHGARAVFFVVGERAAGPGEEILREVLRRGHRIGNHTHTHPRPMRRGFFEYRREIRACERAIEEATGKRPRLFRPPHGAVTPANLAAAWSLGLPTVLWGSGTGEYGHMRGRNAAAIADRFLRSVRGGDIVLMHDSCGGIPEVLRISLPRLREEGFDLAAGIDELPPMA
ncbi:MAG: polysaccharide deacetylase family protein [Candidatus Eisenbacteria bacterium]